MKIVNIVLIKNPFTLDREIKTVQYSPVITVAGYVKPDEEPDIELYYSVNGKTVETPKETFLQPGDYLVVCPVVGKGNGKNPLQLIAGIALSVVTMGVGGLASGAGWGAAVSSWTTMGYLAAAATMYLGGMLMNSWFGTASVDLSSGTTSTTYGWDTPSINQKQGEPLPLTYGTVKVINPTVLSQHISTDGENQYYNLLLCGGEGPIDEITDIRINNNPIKNYSSVVTETRLGTNDQSSMANFADTFSDQSLNYELDEEYWSTVLLEGSNYGGIEVTLEAPNGIYYVDTNGNYTSASVTVKMQTKRDDGDWVDWQTVSITGSSSSAIRKTYRLNGLDVGYYTVRMQVTARSVSKNSTRGMTRLYWTVATAIVYDDFVRPGKALVGIQALATSQLSGSLSSITWLQTRSTVQVYNPNTGTYEVKPATNPAWAAYDLLHLGRHIKNVNTGLYEYVSYGVPKELFNWQRFKDWADYCDEYNLTVNLIIDSTKTLFKALSEIEDCGRGKVFMAGTKFSCICDRPSQPVQMFGMGNIYMDSFQEDFLDLDSRANAAEVTFNNKAKNYERDSFTVYSDGYDSSDAVENPTQITLNGKTSYEEAYREAKYRLLLNKYLIRTCVFEADIDAIACQIGDVILLSHDVPRWGSSGRVVSATETTITLGKAVDLEAGTEYGLYVRLQDDTLVYKTVQPVTVDTTTDTVTVTTPFSSVPQADDVYMFGVIGKEAKPFRVASVTRSKDFRRKITCLEYNDAIYREAVEVPQLNYSSLDTKTLAITASEVFPRPSDGSANILASWGAINDSRLAKVVVLAGLQEGFHVVKASFTSYQPNTVISVGASGTWEITVQGVDLFGAVIAKGNATYTIGTEYLTDPGEISTYYKDNKLVMSITAVSDYRAIQYEWRKGAEWPSAEVCGKTYAPSFTASGDGHYWVSPMYNNVYAKNPSDIVVYGTAVSANVLDVIDESSNGWLGNKTDSLAVTNDVLYLVGDTNIDTFTDFDAIPNTDYAGGVASTGVYTIPESESVDVGSSSMCSVSAVYTLYGENIFQIFDDIVDIDSMDSWDGVSSGSIRCTVQINVAGDDGTWQGWQNFYSGDYYGRLFNFRVILYSNDVNVSTKLSALTITVDVPDIVDQGTVVIPAEGATISYSKVFHAIPGPHITVNDAVANDTIYLPIAAQTKTGFFVQVKNGDVGVARTVHWLAQKW